MKRYFWLCFAILFCAFAGFAQDTVSAAPARAATVRFELTWKEQNPPHYAITIDSAGRATYSSEPTVGEDGGTAPEPYAVEWTATEATRSKVFESVQKLNYLQGQFESRAKVAHTGSKTLSYKDASHDTSTRYNYSENPQVKELTQIFQSIATTAEMARKLIHDARFDKLGVDADLKALQEEQSEGNAVEIIAAQAILQKIAEDPNMMRMSQQRAKAILRAAGVGRSEATSSAEK
jgi:hypothetical protein